MRQDPRQPLVSVVVNCRNGEAYVAEALESISQQSYRSWEVVFVDNCSTDRTPEIAQSFQGPLKYSHTKVPLSLGQARNFALENCSGSFIAFLDADDWWLPDKLARQIPLFDAANVGLVYSDAYSINSKRERKRLSSRRQLCSGWCFQDLLLNYSVTMSSAVIRRSVLNHLDHWFDPQFEMVEEADLFLRIAKHYQVAICPLPLTYWRVHSDSITWQFPQKLADESDTMLNKLLEMFPDLAASAEETIRKKKQWIGLRKGLALWMDGESQHAREVLLSQTRPSLKSIALYLLTFLPPDKTVPTLYRLSSSVVAP